MATNYRLLTPAEIAQLEKQLCVADSWENIQVAENFTPTHIHYTRFPVPSVWEYLKRVPVTGGNEQTCRLVPRNLTQCDSRR